MALTYGFYNSMDGDRKYNATQVSQLFDGIITDGVFSTIGEMFATVPGEGLSVIVKTGRAWFNHTWTLNDSAMVLSLDNPDITLARIDAVVLQIREDDAYRDNKIIIVKGTPSSNPQRPSLTNTTKFHQYPLSYVKVAGAATTIKTADITNVVGTTTPYVTGILRQQSIADIFNQWQGEFEAWFSNVKAQLAGDIVTNLQRQIDENASNIKTNWNNTLSASTKTALGIAATATPDQAFAALNTKITNLSNTLAPKAYSTQGTISESLNASASGNTITVSVGFAPDLCMIFIRSGSELNGIHFGPYSTTPGVLYIGSGSNIAAGSKSAQLGASNGNTNDTYTRITATWTKGSTTLTLSTKNTGTTRISVSCTYYVYCFKF